MYTRILAVHKKLIALMAIVFLFPLVGYSYDDGWVIVPHVPDSVVIVSGDNQSGTVRTLLSAPLVVKVLEADSQALPSVDVTFKVISGGGTLSKGNIKLVNEIKITTDYQGMASVNLTLGNTKGINQVRATVENIVPVVFTATVLNSKPTLGPIGDKEINEGATLRFTVSASDSNPEDVLTLTTNPLPTNATFDPSNGVFTFIPDYTQAGTYSVTFTVSDGIDSDSKKITITVSNINRPPVLVSIGNRTVDENSELTIVVSATDPDNDVLTYTTSVLPKGATFNALQRTFKWKPGYDTVSPGASQDFFVTFTVKDPSGASDSKQATITVNDTIPLFPDIRVLPLISNQPGLDFETVDPGATADRIFQIHNDGNDVLKLTNITTTDAQFQPMTYIKTISALIDVIDPNILQKLSEAAIIAYLGADAKFVQVKHSPSDPLVTIEYPDLSSGECLLIRTQFKPLSVGVKTANFVIKSNDPDEPVIFMALHGGGVLTSDIRVTPDIINFGAVDTGKFLEKGLHVYNDGNAVLKITSVTTDDIQFTASQYTDVNPLSDITIIVKFTPSSAGSKLATLRIVSNDPDNPVVLVQLLGNGIKVPGPDINLSETSIDFAEVELGKSLTKNLMISNVGDAALLISSMTSNNTQFTITTVSTISPGATLAIPVKFTPASEGLKTGLIAITSNDPDESTVVISVKGSGIKFPMPNIRVSPSILDFGNVEVGTSLSKILYIYNDGNATLKISSITSNNILFVVVDKSDVSPGGMIMVPIQFISTSLGQKEGTITIKSNDTDEPNKTMSVRGNGISKPEPNISVTPTSMDFGDVVVGNSPVKNIQITNTGNRQLTIYGITSNNEQFVVINSTTTIAPGNTATISVRFSPLSSGLKTGTVSINSDDPDTPTKIVILQGNGIVVPVPDIDVFPTSIDFGLVEVNKSLSKDLRIYNRGNATLQISSITSDNVQFTVLNATSIPSGGTMLLSVRFIPTSMGQKTGTITIVSNDPDEPSVSISIYGDGMYPGFVDVGVWTPIQQSNILYDLNDVFFTDENHGWVVGYNGTVINTVNKGANWSIQSSGTSRLLNSVFFTDSNTGWVVGQYGIILKTINGGYSWYQLNTTVSNTLRAIKLVSSGKGWAVGESGTIMTVNNDNWSNQNSGTTFDLNSLDFVNSYQGWIVGNYGTILKTIDGGQIWTYQPSGTTSALYGVDFVNSYEGWVVGSNGTILHTQDGGQTWSSQNSGVNYAVLTDVSFLNTVDGWVVGSDGIILHTIDGGLTWIRVDSGTTKSLKAVQFQNPSIGWAVGTNGTILKYTPDYPTKITSVTVSGSPARTGGIIKVTAIGQTRNEATFSITGVVSNVAMREDTSGTYVGTYTVVEGVNVKNTTVVVSLTNKYGNTIVDMSQKVTIDTIAEISSATISPNIAKAGDTVTITAFGETNSAVRFTIENVVNDVVMLESLTIPGKYIGTYKVPQGINVTNAKVSMRLTDAIWNVAVKEVGQITIDSLAQITSVTATGSPAKLGDPIVIVMMGDANGIAKFSIGNLASNITMTETQSGVYTGSYTAPKGTQVIGASVIVQLTDALGNTTTKDGGSVTIDTESKITSVTVTGSPGKAGEKIKVEMVGEANGRAKFSIAGISGEQPMTEQTVGIGNYIGSYTIPNDVNVNEAVVTVTLIDAVGNTATNTSRKVTIDNIVPNINSVNVTGSPVRVGGKITVNMTGEPNGRAKFNIGDIAEENMQEQPIGSGNYTGSHTISINTNVSNAIVTVTLIDLVGNYSTDTSKKVTIDNTPPNITSVKVTGSPGRVGDNITVSMVGEPDGKAEFSILGVVSNQSMAEQPTGSGNYSGSYTIFSGVNVTDVAVTITLSDQAGNISTDTTQKVTIDTIPPKITSVSVSGSPAKVNETITVTLVGEKGGIAQFSIAGVTQNIVMNESNGNPGTYTGKYTVTNDKSVSNAVVTVTLKDNAGNSASDTSKKVSIVFSWDVDRSGTVNVSDITLIANSFGQKVSGKNDADVNNDGYVNILDLIIVTKHFGESSTPASPSKESNVSPENLSVLKSLYKSIENLPSSDPDVAMAKELLIRLIKLNTPQITESQLLQNYPNPFNPETWIPFRLSKPGTVNLGIYSASGQLIRSIDLGYKDMGDYSDKDKSAYWDGKNESGEQVSSGIYFYSIKAGDFTAIKKMIVKK